MLLRIEKKERAAHTYDAALYLHLIHDGVKGGSSELVAGGLSPHDNKGIKLYDIFPVVLLPFLSCADDDNASPASADNSYCESRISTALASKAMFNSNSMTPPLTVKSIEILALTLCTSYECLQLAQASHQYGPASNGRETIILTHSANSLLDCGSSVIFLR